MSAREPYEQIKATGASDALIAGFDILTDDDYPADRAAEILVAAERGGRDPEAFARHMVRLRKALR